MTGLLACAVAVAAASGAGLLYRARNGRMRAAGAGRPGDVSVSAAPGPAVAAGAPGGRLSPADLGQSLGSRATLVQFSTAFCAPCRATRRVLAEVAAMVDGVTHVEIDAGSRLDLVRRLGVRRTPTVLVLGPDGQICQRASGQPRKADVIAAVGRAARPAC